MKALSTRSLLFAAALCFAALFSSCSKEALVEPVQQHVTSGTKSSTLLDTPGTSGSMLTNTGTIGDGADISDDGDDLSGSERSRKKHRN